MRGSDLTVDDAAAALARADAVANRDNYHGTRAERVADVQTELLAGVVSGLVAVANELEQLRRNGLPVENPYR